jgi:hypothetical protein
MERMQGLEPAAQEFHKKMLLLQDFYDEFLYYVSDLPANTQLIKLLIK